MSPARPAEIRFDEMLYCSVLMSDPAIYMPLVHTRTVGDSTIVRASFGVAETGSVLLSDADLRINAVAYLAQHLIVLLDPADIVEFRSSHYACFHTGPYATADIEGVLIHGAQSVRSLSILPIVRASGNLSH